MICTHKNQPDKKWRLMIINDHIYVKVRLQEKYKRYKIVYHNSQLNPKRKKKYRNKNPLNKSITQTQGCRKFEMVNHECLVFNKQEVHSGTKIYNSSRAGNIPIVLAISPISVDQNHRNLIF